MYMKDVLRRKVVIGLIVGFVLIVGGMLTHDVVLKQHARTAYAQHKQIELNKNVTNLIFTTQKKKTAIIKASRYRYWDGKFYGSLGLQK